MTAWSSSAQESSVDGARAAARAAPRSVEASLAYGQALRRAGRETEALSELRRGLGVSGGRSELAGRVLWEIARTYIARREFEPAMATCRSMGRTAELASHVCTAEAHLLWRRGTEAQAELDKLSNAKAAPSLDVQYFGKLASGRAKELASLDADAEAAYREAIALADRRADAHLRLGMLLRRTDRDGLTSIRRAVELEPRDPVAQLELARSLPVGSAEGIEALKRATAERPTFVEALRALAEGLVASQRSAEAKPVLAMVLKLQPNDPITHVLTGRIALAEGRADDAIKEGETASTLMPNAQAARLLVADGWAAKGEIDLAVEAYQAAFGLDHSDPTPLVNGAAACLAAGRTTSAKAFALRATKEFGQSAQAWTALGDALSADRDVGGAKAAYETAKKARGADPAMLDRKLARLK